MKSPDDICAYIYPGWPNNGCGRTRARHAAVPDLSHGFVEPEPKSWFDRPAAEYELRRLSLELGALDQQIVAANKKKVTLLHRQRLIENVLANG